jgi:acetyltransferase-like isoleucine patch superfamily enzyme
MGVDVCANGRVAAGMVAVQFYFCLESELEPLAILDGLLVESSVNPFPFIVRLFDAVNSRRRNVWFRLLGVRLGGYVWMRRISIPRQWSDITIERNVSLDDGMVLLCSGVPREAKISIGEGTYINRYTMIDAHREIKIGRNCMIGPHCYITDANHGKGAGVLVKHQSMEMRPVIIEDDVWLGAGVIVLPGVRLGRACVIGAGAVVTTDVPPEAVYAGVPAARIGSRAAYAARAATV